MDFEWTWQEPVDGLPPDQLGRGEYARFLTEFLNSKATRSYVMNLNAEWGAGKTYFLKRWFNEVKKHHPAAYIDAWKNDFSEDPLLTVITEITEALKSNPDVAAENYRDDLFRSGGRLLKQAGPAFFKGILKTYAGVDSDEFDVDSFNDAAEKALTLGVEEHKNKLKELDNFKTSIKQWLQDCFEHGQKQPMYVFIDELDRCRPTYAIEMLETVKHLFEMQGLVFLIATDTSQLKHSIRAVYGEGFDSSKYLYRFFNRSYSLPTSDSQNFIEADENFGDLWTCLQFTVDGRIEIEEPGHLSEALAGLAECFNFDLRTTKQWLEQLLAVYSQGEVREKYFWPVIAIFLGMRLSDPDLYRLHVGLEKSDKDGETLRRKVHKGFMNRRTSSQNPLSKMYRIKIDNSYIPRVGIHSDLRIPDNFKLPSGFDHMPLLSDIVHPQDIQNINEAFQNSTPNTNYEVIVNKLTKNAQFTSMYAGIDLCTREVGTKKEDYIKLVEFGALLS